MGESDNDAPWDAVTSAPIEPAFCIVRIDPHSCSDDVLVPLGDRGVDHVRTGIVDRRAGGKRRSGVGRTMTVMFSMATTASVRSIF